MFLDRSWPIRGGAADIYMPLITMLLLLFLTFSVLVANPKKLLYTVVNPARGLLNREKRTKEKVWQNTPPPPPTLLVRRK